ELDVRDQLGLNPVRAANRVQRRAGHERRRIDLDLAELLVERAQALRREARANAADVAQLVTVIERPEQKRAEADSCVGRIRESADYELPLLNALDLQPVGRAPASIMRRAPLRHDAL